MVKLKAWGQGGDTIVEVLLSIAIISAVITGAYAIANRALQQGITASEHTQALKLAESQIESLKFREQSMDKQSFISAYATPTAFTNFCLDTTAAGPTDPNWAPLDNGKNTSALQTPGAPAYNTKCSSPTGAPKYYINISLPAAYTGFDPTVGNLPVYLVSIRWDAVNGGVSQTQLFYHMGGVGVAAITGPPVVTPPSSCIPQLMNLVKNPDFSLANDPGAGVAAGFTNPVSAGFTTNLPFRGFGGTGGNNIFPNDDGSYGPNFGWDGGYSINNGYFMLVDAGPGFISGYLEQYPFPGDPDPANWPVDPAGNKVPVGQVSTWWNSNPVQSISQPKGTYPAAPDQSYKGMIWEEANIPVVSGKTYQFAAYFDNLYSNTEPLSAAPVISLDIKGASGTTEIFRSTVFATQAEPKVKGHPWQFIPGLYTAKPGETSVTISINDNEGNIFDDNFAMTHISFRLCGG